MSPLRSIVITLATLSALGSWSGIACAVTVDEIVAGICKSVEELDPAGIRAIDQRLYGLLEQMKTQAAVAAQEYQKVETPLKDAAVKVQSFQHELGTVEGYIAQANRHKGMLTAYMNQVVQLGELRVDLQDKKKENAEPGVIQAIESQIRATEEHVAEAQKVIENEDYSYLGPVSQLVGHKLPEGIRNEGLNAADKFGLSVTVGYLEAPLTEVLENIRLQYHEAFAEFTKTAGFWSEAVDARGRLEVMEEVIKGARPCIDYLLKVSPDRDLVIYWRTHCKAPDFRHTFCIQGSTWLNFEVDGDRAVGAGFGRLCGYRPDGKECYDQPPFQITEVSGGKPGGSLNATITYLIPSDQARKDTGQFTFTGVLGPGEVSPHRSWQGSGNCETIEHKRPDPPFEDQVINCSGTWETTRQLRCDTIPEQIP